jgi:hypothetical protein
LIKLKLNKIDKIYDWLVNKKKINKSINKEFVIIKIKNRLIKNTNWIIF